MRKRRTPLLEEDLPEEPLINLTPLIDVVFVVLIAFMLIAPLLSVDSIQLAPNAQNKDKEMPSLQNAPIAIYIRADNSIWFREKTVNLQDLEKLLSLEKFRNPGTTPKVIPDAKAHFEIYQAVKNTLETCGFEEMDIILRPS